MRLRPRFQFQFQFQFRSLGAYLAKIYRNIIGLEHKWDGIFGIGLETRMHRGYVCMS